MGWRRAVLSATVCLRGCSHGPPRWTDIQAESQAAQGLGLWSVVRSGSNPSKLSLKRVPVLLWSLGLVISQG